jgi:AraC-like DNA-binding protein
MEKSQQVNLRIVEIVQEMFRFAAIGMMSLLSVHLLRRHRWSHSARIGALLALCMAVYLIIPFVLKYAENRLILGGLLFPAFSNSFLIWIFCRSLFSDRLKLKGLHYSLWGSSQLISYMVYFGFPKALFHWGARFQEFEFIHRLLPQGFYLGFILAAIAASQKDGREDLVSSRIKLRRAFLAVVAFYGVLICAAEILLQGQPASHGIDALHYSILLILAGLFFREARIHPDLFQESQTVHKSDTTQEIEEAQESDADQAIDVAAKPVTEISPLHKDLIHWVEVEKVYREDGLTIGQLARKMKTQEYLLRACINGKLGFRNFNDFLNHYRVQEACSRLRSEPSLPIFNLSMELGYGSLAPFNRAFKSKVGKTPSQYKVKP